VPALLALNTARPLGGVLRHAPILADGLAVCALGGCVSG
jgi:hypothetical protein